MDLLKGIFVIIIIIVVSIILTHDEECASYARENARDKWHGEDLFHKCQTDRELRKTIYGR
jgi:hypothetical protein